jgi:hypothetical protein
LLNPTDAIFTLNLLPVSLDHGSLNKAALVKAGSLKAALLNFSGYFN